MNVNTMIMPVISMEEAGKMMGEDFLNPFPSKMPAGMSLPMFATDLDKYVGTHILTAIPSMSVVDIYRTAATYTAGGKMALPQWFERAAFANRTWAPVLVLIPKDPENNVFTARDLIFTGSFYFQETGRLLLKDRLVRTMEDRIFLRDPKGGYRPMDIWVGNSNPRVGVGVYPFPAGEAPPKIIPFC